MTLNPKLTSVNRPTIRTGGVVPITIGSSDVHAYTPSQAAFATRRFS